MDILRWIDAARSISRPLYLYLQNKALLLPNICICIIWNVQCVIYNIYYIYIQTDFLSLAFNLPGVFSNSPLFLTTILWWEWRTSWDYCSESTNESVILWLLLSFTTSKSIMFSFLVEEKLRVSFSTEHFQMKRSFRIMHITTYWGLAQKWYW